MLLVFALTLFSSATLLFLVQPMVGKAILPLLGGSPEVWNTCMVFFQALLLAGYAYAHATIRWLGVRKQALLHLGVLLLPLLFLPITVNKNLIHGGETYPILSVLLLLVVSCGVPFFVISTSAPLLQKWFASTTHPAARDPYFLYGASNIGSMLALLGYPTLVEPWLTLSNQRLAWAIAYGFLLLLTGGCVAFLWLSPQASPSPPEEEKTPAATETERGSVAIKPAPESGPRSRGKGRKRLQKSSSALTPTRLPVPDEPKLDHPLGGVVTWKRRLRWIILSAVPSSLMMGVTTYTTTDLAAMPLLWVGPLALYLLSFIIVFARVPRMVHQSMILTMPLLVLLLVFLMQSEVHRDMVFYNIGLHMASLFVVAMVCHGELAQDRPATSYLTEFYLLMSVGGVLGGLFNALLAPQAFNSLLEYDLAMVASCLLLPPLTDEKPAAWALTVDLVMAGLFMLVGLVLMVFRLFEQSLNMGQLIRDGNWIAPLAALLCIVGAGLIGILRARREEKPLAIMDLVLPLSLVVLIIGLFWGLTTNVLFAQVTRLSELWDIKTPRLLLILTYGLPTILCYTFVERSLRFGLGVAALLLGSAFVSIFHSELVLQKRSFFGVLTVKYEHPFIELMHGTTLHGRQLCPGPEDNPEQVLMIRNYLQRVPLTYYHYTGPIGQVFDLYNPDHAAIGLLAGPLAGYSALPDRNPRVGVIGLGTGTLATFGRTGQHFTFYDIDPLVRDIAYNPRYFTYVRDAQARGVKLGEPILNDARLAIERQLAERPDWPEDEKYGILVVDAFSSDAIPVHLITLEALQLYLKVVRQDGLIAFHISNRFLDLRPVLANLAQKEKLVGYYEIDDDKSLQGKVPSTWVVLARSEQALARLLTTDHWKVEREQAKSTLRALMTLPQAEPGVSTTAGLLYLILSKNPNVQPAPWRRLKPLRKVGVWTDDYSNLLSVFGDPYEGN